MNSQTRLALNAINRDFYAAEASSKSFSATRDHAWKGWKRVWDIASQTTEGPLQVLDVGCGNGRFAAFLAATTPERVHYVGVDASQPLLDIAAERAQPLSSAEFRCADVVEQAAIPTDRFDAIVLFGVLHHIPGFETRAALLEALASQLTQSGVLAFTLWRFGAPSLWPRFKSRAVPWNDYNQTAPTPIDPTQLEPGDHLLRWGENETYTEPGSPLRYCHYADEAEREALLETLPLEPIDHYTEDGRTNDLNDYTVMRRRA